MNLLNRCQSLPACVLAAAIFLSACATWGPSGVARLRATATGTAAVVAPAHGYHVVFSDDFTARCPAGSFPRCTHGRWTAYSTGWPDTSGNGTYDCSRVCSEHNGVLDLYLHSEGGEHLVAAPEPILAVGAHDYGTGLRAGRYTIAFKADALPCYKTAWLLWPDSGVWPGTGEIDFPEGRLDGTISAFMHHRGATSGSNQDAYSTVAKYSRWHVAVIEWRPDRGYANFFLDGFPIGYSTAAVPNTAMHWVLQTETGTSGCTPRNSTSGHVLVDFVQVEVPN